MLKSLRVKDYALIREIEVEFGKGLNIITGETGAGKSILIDAMGLLLGERALVEVIRKDAPKAVIEGIFEPDNDNKLNDFLRENDLEEQAELILRREILLKGTNRCFINDTPVTLNQLKEIGNLLVDLHGQHEHQSLLRTETHIDYLDEFASVEELLIDYKKLFNELNRMISELSSLIAREQAIREKKEMYDFQLKEIDSVSPEDGEDEKITDELKILENSEKLFEISSSVYDRLYESDNAVIDTLNEIKQDIAELNRIDRSFSESLNECENATALIKDIAEYLRSYSSRINVDPEYIENLRRRISAINMLKKKYGGSIKSISDFRDKIAGEISLADNFSEKIEEINNEIARLRRNCGTEAGKIFKRRKEVSKKIEKQIIEELAYLGIPDALFKVNIEQEEGNSGSYIISQVNKNYKAGVKGFDKVEFLIAANKGENLKPLVKSASGGEISRVMLALKSTLAKSDKFPLLIFDEIDTGVSGRIAQKVGQSLKNLSSFHQIIAITHLPQIAGLADHHYSVEKLISSERAVSTIRKLDTPERINEVAKLMSGEKITEASLQGARELMGIETK
jgi:DNA repair protein RecN (Recombination protein N)